MRRRKREDMFWINRLTECSCIMHRSPAALAHKGNGGLACKSFITTGLFTPSVRGDRCHAEAKTGRGNQQPSSTSTHASTTLKFVLKEWSYNTETFSTQVWKRVYKSFTFMSVLYAKDVLIEAQTGGIAGQSERRPKAPD